MSTATRVPIHHSDQGRRDTKEGEARKESASHERRREGQEGGREGSDGTRKR